MNATTAWNHQKRYLAILKDEYIKAEVFMPPQKTIIDNLKKKIWEDHAINKVPEYVRAYIRGASDMLSSCYVRQHIEWVLPWNGTYYKCFMDLPEEAKQRYGARHGNSERLTGRYVYKKDNTREW